MRHLIFREAMQSTTLGHAIGSFCVRLLSMSCQIVVCFNRKGSFISIINTRYASNATSEQGTQTGIDPATFETEGKSRNHSATTRPHLDSFDLTSIVHRKLTTRVEGLKAVKRVSSIQLFPNATFILHLLLPHFLSANSSHQALRP